MPRKEYAGGAIPTTLSTSMTATTPAAGGTFSVADATGWPTGLYPFVVTLARGTTAEEKILCSSRSGTTITVSARGVDGTTAKDHAGSNVESAWHTIDAESLTEATAHIHDTTRNDHTQYARLAGAAFTGAVTNTSYVFAAGGVYGGPGADTSGGAGASNVFLPLAAASIGVTVQGLASQTGDLQRWQNSAGTVLAAITAGGTVEAEVVRGRANATTGSQLIYTGGTAYFQGQTTTYPTMAVRAMASQTGDLQQWQDSAGTALTYITYQGHLVAPRAIIKGQFQFQGGSGATYGDFMFGAGGGSREFSLVNQLSSRYILFATGGSDADNATNARLGVGTTVPAGTFHVTAQRTTDIAVVARGLASQTADLQQWQDSAGTALAKISPTGAGAFATARVSSPTLVATVGAELLTNGAFATDLSGWTAGAGWSWSAGTALHATGNTATLAQTVANIVSGSYYLVAFTITGRTAGSITVGLGTVVSSAHTATSSTVLVAAAAGSLSFAITPTTDFDGAVDDLSVKLVTPSVAQTVFTDSGDVAQAEVRANAALTSVAVGQDALRSLTTGLSNTAVGHGALRSLTTTGQNAAVGRDALRDNTTGSSNSAFGSNALSKNTTGNFNMAVGTNALRDNTTGIHNSAIGQGALRNNTTGSQNIAIGSYAAFAPAFLPANATTTGLRQTVVGTEAGQNSATQRNDIVALGYRALVDGDNTVALGSGAKALHAGSVALGKDATTTAIDQVMVGARSVVSTATGSPYVFQQTASPNNFFAAGSAAHVPVLVKGVASQTGNLTEWQNSAGTVMAKVDLDGVVHTPNLWVTASGQPAGGGVFWGGQNLVILGTAGVGTVYLRGNGYNSATGQATLASTGTLTLNPTAAAVGQVIKGAASQTADLQQWQDSAGTLLASMGGAISGTSTRLSLRHTATDTVGQAGMLRLGTTTQEWANFRTGGSGQLALDMWDGTAFQHRFTVGTGAVGQVALVARGVAGQTANLQEWQDSTAAVVASVSPAGAGYFKSNLRADGNIWAPNSYVQAGDSFFNNAGNPGALFVSRGTTWVGMIVKGILNQSADLQQWQDSTGTVLARVHADGGIRTTKFGVNEEAGGGGASVLILPGAASTIGTIIRGLTSQTADLQQWQNSAGGVLAKVDAAGVGTFAAGSTIGGSSLVTLDTAQTITGNKTFSGLSGFQIAPNTAATIFASTDNATRIPVLVRGAASQTADLQQWQNSAGSVLASVDVGGRVGAGMAASASYGLVAGAVSGRSARFYGGVGVGADAQTSASLFVVGDTAGTIPTIVRGAASQTADLQAWQNSAGTVLARVHPGGHFRSASFESLDGTGTRIQANASGPMVLIGQVAGSQVEIVRGAASQTVNLTEWQNSGGSALALIASGGRLGAPSASFGNINDVNSAATLYVSNVGASVIPAVVRGAQNVATVTNKALTSNVATLTTSAVHGFVVGRSVVVAGVDATFNGTYTIASVPTTTTFTYAKTAADVASTAATGTATSYIQTADLQQWQDSTGVVLTRISAGGLQQVSNATGSTVLYLGNDNANNVGLEVRGYFTGHAGNQPASRGAAGGIAVYNENGARWQASLGGDAGLYVEPRATTHVVAIVRGAASQTADLQQWQDSAATALLRVANDGRIGTTDDLQYINNIVAGSTVARFTAKAAGQTALWLQGAASQTADLQQWRNSAGTVLSKVMGKGTFHTGPTGSDAQLNVTPNAAGDVGVIVRGAASQTADLEQWQNSAGTVLAKVESSGFVTSNVGLVGNAGTASRIGGTVLSINSSVAGTIGAIVRGAASQTADLQQWQNSAGTNLARIEASGSITGLAGSYIEPETAGLIGLRVRGKASQTADLQQWQNSAGGILAQMRSSGQFNAPMVSVGADVGNLNSAVYALFSAAPTAGVVPAIARGAASQTANLQEWQNSAGAALALITSTGEFSGTTQYLSGAARVGAGPGSIASLSVGVPTTGTVGVLVRGIASQTADMLRVQNSAATNLLKVDSFGRTSVMASGTDNTEFMVGGETGFDNIGSTLVYFKSRGTSQIAQVIRGIASQTADLTQWQDSAAAVLAKVSSSGALFTNSSAVSTRSEMLALRGGYGVTGGGTVTWSGTALSWTARLIVISHGNGAEFSTGGYFDITVPANGTVITGVGGAANQTVASGAIPIPSWGALYYILPIGGSSPSVAANFRVANYTSGFIPPPEWLLIAVHNADNSSLRFCTGANLKNGWTLSAGETVPFGAVVAQTSFGAAAANGTGGQAARTDHTHGTPATPVTSAVAGTGIGVSAATGAVTFTNTGVTSIVAGTNVTISGSTGAVTVNATTQTATGAAGGYLAGTYPNPTFSDSGMSRAFASIGTHGAHSTGFNSPTDFGVRFIQGTADGPGISGATQYYNFAIGLGSEYAYSSYAMQWAVPRNSTTPYLSFRYREGGTWGSWAKVHAGYADTAGNGGVTSIVAGTNVTISGATGAVTVNAASTSFGTPAVVLGTAAAAGAATTALRTDATIVAFDATAPSTLTMGGAAAVGTAAVAARRDHVHGMPASATSFAAPAVVLGTAAAEGVAATAIRTDATIVAFDATAPTTVAFGTAATTAAVGSAAVAARRDHTHGFPVMWDTTAPAVVTLSTAASGVGTATVNARRDHTHGVSGTLPIANGGTGSTTRNFVDLTSAETVGGAKTFSSLIAASAGVESNGSPSGYNSEFRFGTAAAGAALGLSTLSTGSPIMHFDHRATSNTGTWSWRNGTGAASTQMTLGGAGNLSTTGTVTANAGLVVNGFQAGGLYNSEIRFGSTVTDASAGLTTGTPGSPVMGFAHQATSNTGLWRWSNGGGQRMELAANGDLTITGLLNPAGAWNAPSMLNSWVYYDTANFHRAEYWKDATGVVHLRGLVKNGSGGMAMFGLPSGFRPSKTLLFWQIAGLGGCRIDVRADGNVMLDSYFSGGSNIFVSLEGITFRAEQ